MAALLQAVPALLSEPVFSARLNKLSQREKKSFYSRQKVKTILNDPDWFPSAKPYPPMKHGRLRQDLLYSIQCNGGFIGVQNCGTEKMATGDRVKTYFTR